MRRSQEHATPSTFDFMIYLFPSNGTEDIYRSSDGMLIAQGAHNRVTVSKDKDMPSVQDCTTHQFPNQVWAKKWVRETLCRGSFEEREGESRVIVGVANPTSELALQNIALANISFDRTKN